ncbi:MAG: hypothetical protein PHY92_09165 [Alphaproteobacteria bacterium]|nr:hypothetical protein [Alphaproteobacteria bacterium]
MTEPVFEMNRALSSDGSARWEHRPYLSVIKVTNGLFQPGSMARRVKLPHKEAEIAKERAREVVQRFPHIAAAVENDSAGASEAPFLKQVVFFHQLFAGNYPRKNNPHSRQANHDVRITSNFLEFMWNAAGRYPSPADTAGTLLHEADEDYNKLWVVRFLFGDEVADYVSRVTLPLYVRNEPDPEARAHLKQDFKLTNIRTLTFNQCLTEFFDWADVPLANARHKKMGLIDVGDISGKSQRKNGIVIFSKEALQADTLRRYVLFLALLDRLKEIGDPDHPMNTDKIPASHVIDPLRRHFRRAFLVFSEATGIALPKEIQGEVAAMPEPVRLSIKKYVRGIPQIQCLPGSSAH